MNKKLFAIFVLLMMAGSALANVHHQQEYQQPSEEEIAALVRLIREYRNKQLYDIDGDEALLGGLLGGVSGLVKDLGGLLGGVVTKDKNGGTNLGLSALLDNLLKPVGGLLANLLHKPEIATVLNGLVGNLKAKLLPLLTNLLNGILAKTPLGSAIHISKIAYVEPEVIIAEMQQVMDQEISYFLQEVNNILERDAQTPAISQ